MPKVSIIIPIYNVERYFDQCMQSLLNQTCQDIEIILVDDGSPDNCPAMCDEYQFHHPDIVKVIHQNNCGLNAAWNAGLDVAVGQWVCFVDSDDWVELNMVETMLSYTEKDDADLHIFGHYKDFVNCSVLQSLPNMTLPANAAKNYRHQNQINLNSHSVVWSKLYRRLYLEKNQLRFYPKQFHGEDAIFMLYTMHHANKVQIHSECLYHYRIVASSAINKWDPKKIERIQLFQKRYGEFVDKYFTGTENRQMKQSEAIKGLLDLARFYDTSDAQLTRNEKITLLQEHLNQEPLKSAMKELPLNLIPKRRRWQVQLLRMGHVGIWFDLFRVANRFWIRKIVGHEMYI